MFPKNINRGLNNLSKKYLFSLSEQIRFFVAEFLTLPQDAGDTFRAAHMISACPRKRLKSGAYDGFRGRRISEDSDKIKLIFARAAYIMIVSVNI